MINCALCGRKFNPEYWRDDWDLCPDCRKQLREDDEWEREEEEEED